MLCAQGKKYGKKTFSSADDLQIYLGRTTAELQQELATIATGSEALVVSSWVSLLPAHLIKLACTLRSPQLSKCVMAG